jgi:hypothetical protein
MAHPAASGDSIILDLTIELSCATDDPVTLLEYRYGGLGWRTTQDWDRNNSSVLTSEGLTRADADGSLARWVLVQGAFDDGAAQGGAALLSDPRNFNHPEPLRVWPEDMYERGDLFVSFSPTKNRDWHIEPGKPQTLRYRWIVFDGTRTAKDAMRWWVEYALPANADAPAAPSGDR